IALADEDVALGDLAERRDLEHFPQRGIGERLEELAAAHRLETIGRALDGNSGAVRRSRGGKILEELRPRRVAIARLLLERAHHHVVEPPRDLRLEAARRIGHAARDLLQQRAHAARLEYALAGEELVENDAQR